MEAHLKCERLSGHVLLLLVATYHTGLCKTFWQNFTILTMIKVRTTSYSIHNIESSTVMEMLALGMLII